MTKNMHGYETVATKVEEISKHALNAARLWKTRGRDRKVVGYVCSYAPLEIIAASGALPLRLLNPSASAVRADKHLQSYCCDIVRSLTENALEGEYQGTVDLVVFSHSCDSVQCLSDIWLQMEATADRLSFNVPANMSSEASFDLLVQELEALRSTLAERLGTTIDDSDIGEACESFETASKLLTRIYESKSKAPWAVPAGIVEHAARAFSSYRWDELVPILRELAAAVEQRTCQGHEPSPEDRSKPRLLLAGTALNTPGLAASIEALGAWVAGDDLCTGFRSFTSKGGDSNAAPVHRVAKRIFYKPPCPCKYKGPRARMEHVLDLAEKHEADGVIIARWKFCDPLGFDMPDLSSSLKEAGVKVLELELSGTGEMTSTMEARVSAFIETL